MVYLSKLNRFRSQKRHFGSIDAELETVGQAEFSVNGERHSLEKESLSKLELSEVVLFQEEKIDGKF